MIGMIRGVLDQELKWFWGSSSMDPDQSLPVEGTLALEGPFVVPHTSRQTFFSKPSEIPAPSLHLLPQDCTPYALIQ